MRCLIGIDDTDNPDSRGTGFRARQLGEWLRKEGLAQVRGITRHQLYVHPSIPYTSHNSSACLDVLVDDDSVRAARDFCRDYLLEQSAEGSDAGLCLAVYEAVAEEVVSFGRSAKSNLLGREQAHQLARNHGVYLEGLTGERIGVIGALAAVGLRRGGEDGRFIWLEGVRELSGKTTAGRLLAATGIESVETTEGQSLPAEATVLVDPWPRPVLLGGRAVLLTESCEGGDGSNGWKILSKEVIRRY